MKERKLETGKERIRGEKLAGKRIRARISSSAAEMRKRGDSSTSQSGFGRKFRIRKFEERAPPKIDWEKSVECFSPELGMPPD